MAVLKQIGSSTKLNNFVVARPEIGIYSATAPSRKRYGALKRHHNMWYS